jgi:hypothetical protein
MDPNETFMPRRSRQTASAASRDEVEWLRLVQEQVKSLSYGVVQVIVHDARVVQIETAERLRLDRLPVKPISRTTGSPESSTHDNSDATTDRIAGSIRAPDSRRP